VTAYLLQQLRSGYPLIFPSWVIPARVWACGYILRTIRIAVSDLGSLGAPFCSRRHSFRVRSVCPEVVILATEFWPGVRHKLLQADDRQNVYLQSRANAATSYLSPTFYPSPTFVGKDRRTTAWRWENGKRKTSKQTVILMKALRQHFSRDTA
jgi:hypothetical protein